MADQEQPEPEVPEAKLKEPAASDVTNYCNTTVKDLMSIITEPAGGLVMMPSDAYNEVFDGIFVGEASTALTESELQKIGITHVLNAAFGNKLCHVNTGPEFYKSGIVFHGIPAIDSYSFKMDHYFHEAADFIGQAVGTKETGKQNKKIFVHCKEGFSRSAALVLAYLVRDHDMHIKEAVRHVRSKREICPNRGFLKQLIVFSSQFGRA